MFSWFTSQSSSNATAGIGKIRNDFIEMLQTARAEFLLACRVALYGIDVDSVREELAGYDKSVNRAERQIRKELVVHCSVRSMIDPESLVIMSIAKDAERLGDYAKNIFDMGEEAPTPPVGVEREELIVLKLLIRKLFDECIRAFQNEDEDLARQIIIESQWAGKQCDIITRTLLNLETPTRRTASDVLMFRFMKRMTSHLRNISSSVVQPIHKLDFTKKITKTVEMSGTLLDKKAELIAELEAEALENKQS